jgi:hypothetical protein
MRSIQHAPAFEVVMIICFKDGCRRVEMQDFGLPSDTRFGQLVEAALTAQHQQHTKNLMVLFYLRCYLFCQLSGDGVSILFGQLSELHQFDFLGTSSELFREHLQTSNRIVCEASWLRMCFCLLRTYQLQTHKTAQGNQRHTPSQSASHGSRAPARNNDAI